MPSAITGASIRLKSSPYFSKRLPVADHGLWGALWAIRSRTSLSAVRHQSEFAGDAGQNPSES